MRKVVVSVIAIVAFVLNPLYACDALLGPDFTFGEAEMRAAVEGTWEVRVGERRLEIRISHGAAAEQHSATGFLSTAAACGNRSFVKSAAACIDSSAMPIEILVLDGMRKTAGELVVHGTAFELASLRLSLEGMAIHATITPAGKVVEVLAEGATPIALRRLSR